MPDTSNWLLIICSLAGFALLGGSLALLWCRRITLDGRAIGCQPDGQKGGDAAAPGGQASQTPNQPAAPGGQTPNQPPASEINLWGKIMMKTPYPVLLMFLIGALLIAFPVYGSINPSRMVTIKGKLGERGQGTTIKVVAVVREQPVGAGQTVNIRVPYFENGIYVVKYSNDYGDKLGEDYISMQPGKAEYELLGVDPELAALTATKKAEAPAAKQSGVESKQVVEEFKNVVNLVEESNVVNQFK